jgi:hypothetical protein
MTELFYEPVERRRSPKVGDHLLDDGNWLVFALANRWISVLKPFRQRRIST